MISIFNIFAPIKTFAATPTQYSSLVPEIQQAAKQVAPNGAISGEPLNQLLNSAVYLILVIAVVLAIFMIIRGGYEYMTSSDNSNKKGTAKKRLQAALGGLLLAIGAVLILKTINPNLVNFSIEFPGLEKPNTPPESNEITYTSSGGYLPEYPYDVSWIDWSNPNQQITENFTVRDVTKGDSSRVPQSEEDMRRIVAMAYELEKVQTAWGGDIKFTSWYRPPAVNASVGGATHSQHIEGVAVDIYPANGELQQFQNWLLNNWSGGVGVYDSWVHIDMREGGGFSEGSSPSARW